MILIKKKCIKTNKQGVFLISQSWLKEGCLMKKITQVFLLLIFIFAVNACIPVSVPVGTSSPGYEQPYGYGYGYDDQYDYDYDDEYVDVPIVYGEPMYYTPPITVTFVFDYFTYEMVGGYVDIVFWRGGHRYHHEPWYDHGRRISPDYIRTNPHHRIRGPEFFKHREKLRKNHKISHPDNYYGLKHPKKPDQQRPKPGEQRPQWEQKQPPQIEKRPQWGEPPPKQTEQRPSLEQKGIPQVEKRPQWGAQEPQQTEKKPQWGKKEPQQTDKRLQWGQQQPKTQQGTLRQPSQQTKQLYQKEKQKRLQEKQKKIRKKPEKDQKQEQEQTPEEKTKQRPQPRW